MGHSEKSQSQTEEQGQTEEQAALFKAVMDGAGFGIVIAEPIFQDGQDLIEDFRILHVNERATETVEKDADELIGKAAGTVFPLFRRWGVPACRTAWNEGETTEIEGKMSSGFMPTVVKLVFNRSGDWIITSIDDVSAQAMQQSIMDGHAEELYRVANSDSLTGLANRRTFDTRVSIEIVDAGRENRRMTLVMMDLDRFKLINDTHGHDVGDLVLAQTADVIRNHTRAGDDLAARIGGEEFAILLPDTSVTTATHICERLRKSLEALEVMVGDGEMLRVTASFGIAELIPTGERAFHEALLAADKALYAAKDSGRNRVFVNVGDTLELSKVPRAEGAIDP